MSMRGTQNPWCIMDRDGFELISSNYDLSQKGSSPYTNAALQKHLNLLHFITLR